MKIRAILLYILICSNQLYSQSLPDNILWMPAIFNKNMILQRDKPVRFWGKCVPGKQVTVTFNQHNYTTIGDKSGNWVVWLPATNGGFDVRTITVASQNVNKVFDNVLFGDVFLAGGQSNMQREFKTYDIALLNKAKLDADYPAIRLHRVPSIYSGGKSVDTISAEIPWQSCSPEIIKSWSPLAFFFAREIYKSKNIPVGIISCSHGSSSCDAWISPEAFAADSRLDAMKRPYSSTMGAILTNPSSLYNLMLKKVMPYTLKSFLWYQGESNSNYAREHNYIFPGLIADWRKQWNDSTLPFLFVQISAYQKPRDPTFTTWAYLRETQTNTWKHIPYTGMAVSIDKGDSSNIHPVQKEIVGIRLADQAKVIVYGDKFIYSGPLFRNATFTDGYALINFYFAQNGLKSEDGDLREFEICGADFKYYPAHATIFGQKQVKVWAPEVSKPVAVRYAFKNWCRPNLYNTEGLPAVPFRTNENDDHSLFDQQILSNELIPYAISETANCEAFNAINNSGLMSGTMHGNTVLHTTWISDNTGSAGYFKIKLKNKELIDFINIWNLNVPDKRIDQDVRDVEIYTSTSDKFLANTPFTNKLWMKVSSVTLEKASGKTDYMGEKIHIGSTTPIQWVGINILNNYGSATKIGLSEIKLYKPKGTGISEDRIFNIKLIDETPFVPQSSNPNSNKNKK